MFRVCEYFLPSFVRSKQFTISRKTFQVNRWHKKKFAEVLNAIDQQVREKYIGQTIDAVKETTEILLGKKTFSHQ